MVPGEVGSASRMCDIFFFLIYECGGRGGKCKGFRVR